MRNLMVFLLLLALPTSAFAQQTTESANQKYFYDANGILRFRKYAQPTSSYNGSMQSYQNGSGLKYQGITGVPAGSKLY